MHQSPTTYRPRQFATVTSSDVHVLAGLIAKAIEKAKESLAPWVQRKSNQIQFINQSKAAKSRAEGACGSTSEGNLTRAYKAARYIAVADLLHKEALNVPNLAKKLAKIQECMKTGEANESCKKIIELTLDRLAKDGDQKDFDPDELAKALKANAKTINRLFEAQ